MTTRQIIGGILAAIMASLLLRSDESECGCRQSLEDSDMPESRHDIVSVACSEYFDHAHDPRVNEYWAVSGLKTPYPPAWCGAFALWALRQAGIDAPDWTIGLGFVAPANLHITDTPLPGDIMYRDQPWQHYGLVRCVDSDTAFTIEGNTPGISLHAHPISDRRYVYYSIAPLLQSTFGKPL